ncbi:MAG: hypothetical protein GY913_26125 [Proteobacteria bacterium]|nr:hypothetical protein [Pseudomonadota bacterium]MCP4920394.1 hypothetical protein [Pseudomonadota bacterium]
MQREAAPVVAGSVALAALLLRSSWIQLGEVLPGGPRSWAQAWGAWRLGGAEPEVAGDVLLAGWPVLGSIAALDLILPLVVATTLAVTLWLAAGLASAYVGARRLGAEPLTAGAVAVFAGANPAVLQGVSEGRYEWLVVPWVALGLVAAMEERHVLVAVACLGAALHTPLLGASLAGLVVLAASSRSWRAGGLTLAAAAVPVVAVGALSWGVQSIPFGEKIVHASGNAGDWLEPFFAWRDDATAPQLGLWLGAPLALLAWRRGVLHGALALGAAAALVLSIGPELRWGAVAYSLDAAILPAPAALLDVFVPLEVVTWKSVLVPGLVAGALALSRLDRRAAIVLALGALVHIVLNPIGSVAAGSPQALSQLPGEGPVLNLPVDVERDGNQLRWLFAQTQHRRPLLTGMEPPEPAVFLADPLVVLSINAVAGHPRHAVPDQTATVVLQGLGVETVVLDRDAVPIGGRVLLDEVLGRYVGAAQRDLAGGIDVYSLERGDGVEAEATLLMDTRTGADGHLEPDAWLVAHPPGR